MQIQIVHNAVNAKLQGGDRDVKLLVQKELSYLVDGAQFAANPWHGRSSFFDFGKETFPAGFVYLVYKALLVAGHKVQLIRAPAPAPLGPERPVVDDFGYDPKYEYQPQVADKLIKHRQIIAQVATGGGKSRIARICYKRIDRRTLFVTTRSILLHQMKDAVEKNLKERVSVIGDDYPWPERPTQFTCAMVQTLSQAIVLQDPLEELQRVIKNRTAAEDREVAKLIAAIRKKHKLKEKDLPTPAQAAEINNATNELRKQLKAARRPDKEIAEKVSRDVIAHNAHREKVIAYLQTVEFVILEEAHESSGEGYYEVMRHCTKAVYRLSLTATPFMRDSAEANMRLMACSGPIAVTVTEKQLIDLGVLATPYFKYVTPKEEWKPKDLYRTTPWPRCHEIGVVEADWRNRAIVSEALRAASYGSPVLVLVTRREHGKILQELMTQAGLRVNYIFGDHEQDERQAALNALRDGKIDVLIGSTILDVGVDCPSIGLIVLAGAGKAEVATRQRIGRGLRAKKYGPNVAFVLDFADDFNNTLREHTRDRQMIVSLTPGFRERIVNDFDYDGLGFARKAA